MQFVKTETDGVTRKWVLYEVNMVINKGDKKDLWSRYIGVRVKDSEKLPGKKMGELTLLPFSHAAVNDVSKHEAIVTFKHSAVRTTNYHVMGLK